MKYCIQYITNDKNNVLFVHMNHLIVEVGGMLETIQCTQSPTAIVVLFLCDMTPVFCKSDRVCLLKSKISELNIGQYRIRVRIFGTRFQVPGTRY